MPKIYPVFGKKVQKDRKFMKVLDVCVQKYETTRSVVENYYKPLNLSFKTLFVWPPIDTTCLTCFTVTSPHFHFAPNHFAPNHFAPLPPHPITTSPHRHFAPLLFILFVCKH